MRFFLVLFSIFPALAYAAGGDLNSVPKHTFFGTGGPLGTVTVPETDGFMVNGFYWYFVIFAAVVVVIGFYGSRVRRNRRRDQDKEDEQ